MLRRATVLRISALAAGLAMGVGVLAGCSTPAPSPSSAAPTPDYTSSFTPAPATVLAPLTGVEVAPGQLSGPSLAAKIDNHPAARPQVGLERTDLVFEELVEGGLTRYVAVWYSDVPAEIGPIRSIRPMDPDIVSPLGGIVAYSGGQQRFVSMMQSTNVYNAVHGMGDTADVMFRTPSKSAPHNVLVKAPELRAMHADIAAPPQLWSFAADAASSGAVTSGGAVGQINLVFGGAAYPSWTWDAASGRYLRSQMGAPDLDSAGAQLSAANVVVVRVPVSNDGGVPKTELIGSGEAVVSSGGSTVSGTWSKGSATDPIKLVDAQGFTIRLAPGNSWIELVPTSGSAEFVPAG